MQKKLVDILILYVVGFCEICKQIYIFISLAKYMCACRMIVQRKRAISFNGLFLFTLNGINIFKNSRVYVIYEDVYALCFVLSITVIYNIDERILEILKTIYNIHIYIYMNYNAIYITYCALFCFKY